MTHTTIQRCWRSLLGQTALVAVASVAAAGCDGRAHAIKHEARLDGGAEKVVLEAGAPPETTPANIGEAGVDAPVEAPPDVNDDPDIVDAGVSDADASSKVGSITLG